jgi:myosin heavy subunit
MINGPGVSIFSITNDNTTQQQCTDKNIKSSIQDRLGQMGLMEFSHKNQALFTIKHSQCAVEYSVEGFKMKNLDKVNEEVGDLIGKIKMFKGKDKEKVEKQAGRTLLKKFGAEI